MSIRFACPGCQAAIRVEDTLAGQHRRCPRYQTSLQVPCQKPAAASDKRRATRPVPDAADTMRQVLAAFEGGFHEFAGRQGTGSASCWSAA